MTAEPDALRLVPVNARDLDALRYVLNRADEASRIRTVMSTFTLPERETTAERLERLYVALKAAAPAVQPAAGRETIEFLEERVSDETMRALLSCNDVGSGRAHLASILAALAHPPAQGSESGGEAVEQACGLTVDVAVSQPAEALSILRALPKSQSLFVWADGSYRVAPTLDIAIARQEEGSLVAVIPVTDLNAALSQPGPASEGDGE